MCPHHSTPTAKNATVLFNYNISVGLGKAIWALFSFLWKFTSITFTRINSQKQFPSQMLLVHMPTGKIPPTIKNKSHTNTHKAMHEETGRMENTLSFYGLSHSLAGLPKYKPYHWLASPSTNPIRQTITSLAPIQPMWLTCWDLRGDHPVESWEVPESRAAGSRWTVEHTCL